MSPGIDNLTVTDKLTAPVQPGTVGRHKIGKILQGSYTGKEKPGLDAGVGPGRSNKKTLRSSVDHGPEHLGKPQVVTGGKTELAEIRRYHCYRIARRQNLCLIRFEGEKMHLPVGPDDNPCPVDKKTGVVIDSPVFFNDAPRVDIRGEIPRQILEC